MEKEPDRAVTSWGKVVQETIMEARAKKHQTFSWHEGILRRTKLISEDEMRRTCLGWVEVKENYS